MNQLETFREVRAFVFDVDGVFTNNEILVMENGDLLRTMNVRDGYAVKLAIKAGYPVAIITGGTSEGVTKRLQVLGVTDIYSGVGDKVPALRDFMGRHNISPGEILYMGDDLPDYPVMRMVGLPCCPHDAVPEVLGVATYVSHLPGGGGCVRDVVEKVMKLAGQWFEKEEK